MHINSFFSSVEIGVVKSLKTESGNKICYIHDLLSSTVKFVSIETFICEFGSTVKRFKLVPKFVVISSPIHDIFSLHY